MARRGQKTEEELANASPDRANLLVCGEADAGRQIVKLADHHRHAGIQAVAAIRDADERHPSRQAWLSLPLAVFPSGVRLRRAESRYAWYE